jgi:tRNA(fMet)-specific endonuclease VapC
MNYLLDTDTCVYALRGRASVREHLITAGPSEVAISIVTLAELSYGAACSARPDDNHRAIDDFAQGISLLGIDPAITRVYGDLKASLRATGELLEDFDLLIGAAASSLKLTLVTNNLDHFRRITGLRLETLA